VGKWLRRIRGAIGIGLTWGAAWAAVGSVPRWLFGFNTDAPFPLIFGVLGFIAGVIFSGVLMLTEGRRGFDEMKFSRFAAWGAVAGFLLSAIFTRAASLAWADALAIAPTFAVAGAICASGSLALARRAGMRELPDNRGDTAEAELADHERRRLL
jgi:FtsH-binding integral membrane protein